MTRTPALLGPDYDAPAKLPDGLATYLPKRDLAKAALDRAEAAGDVEATRLMRWELGILDLMLVREDDTSVYRGADYQKYAEFYQLTPETATYALERANETSDIVLKLHYLEYALLQMPQTGRAWIDLQRQILDACREYVDGCRAAAIASRDPQAFAGVHIDRALLAIGRLLRKPGLLRGTEGEQWAEWLVELAEASRDFPVRSDDEPERMRHRWVSPYLVHLADLPPAASSPALRTRALQLINTAAAYYGQHPLDDHFQRCVAEDDALLRKHWGEAGTHERLIQRQFDSLIQRAEFHRNTGNGMLTAHFFREARRLVEQHRQYFEATVVADLERKEQAGLEHAVSAGEFSTITVSVKIPHDMMDFTRDSAEATVAAIVAEIASSVPNRRAITEHMGEVAAETPMQSLIGRSVIGRGKVVGESTGPEQNLELDVEQHAVMVSHLLGEAVANTIGRAAASIGLTVDHLMAPLRTLAVDSGTLDLIRCGCERVIAQDYVSALHILVPRIEDVLRQQLKSLGVDTTEFQRDVGDGTSRTDDATFGALMRKALPDGRAVRDYLGSDLWDHLDSVLNSQTGLNLRNHFAHGLARPQDCTPDNAGLVLSLFYLLAHVAAGATAVPAGE